MVRGTQREVGKEGTQGSVAVLKERKRPRLCVSKFRCNEFYSTESWTIGIERFGGTHLKFSGWHLVQNWMRERKRHPWRHYPKRWTSWAKSLRACFWGTTTWGNLTTSRSYQQSSVEFGEKMSKLTPNIKLRLNLLWRCQRLRISYVCYGFGSFNAQCWSRRTELRYNGYFEKVQNPYSTYRDRGQCK